MNKKRITINLCSRKDYDWLKYNHIVMLQAVSPDTIACTFWGGCIKFNKRDVYQDKIEKTAHVIEAVTKCILQNISRDDRIAFCILLPLGGGYREYCWLRLFMAGFFKNKCIRDGLTVDMFSKYRMYDEREALNEYLPQSVISIINRNYSCIVQNIIDEFESNVLTQYFNNFTLDENGNVIFTPEKYDKSDLKSELIEDIKARKEEFEKTQEESVRFDEYLKSMYERKARQEIQDENYNVTSTTDRALGGWKRKFHGEIYENFDDKKDLIKGRVHKILKGESLKSNRILLLYICYKLSMSCEEVKVLFNKGKLDNLGEPDDERILLALIDRKDIKEDDEAVYDMLADYGYFDLYELIGATIDDKEEGIDKKKVQKKTQKKKKSKRSDRNR